MSGSVKRAAHTEAAQDLGQVCHVVHSPAKVLYLRDTRPCVAVGFSCLDWPSLPASADSFSRWLQHTLSAKPSFARLQVSGICIGEVSIDHVSQQQCIHLDGEIFGCLHHQHWVALGVFSIDSQT